ncbi:hypothetical protein HOK51_09745 [Candidatus Woesearchaeota archaeon]|jgi:hypothetical protein|nr:hypothetical protein [Candidatus Woesearchaeota archaeon]MBT6520106.1 hypothetical protein [Candidatus Woesearchaeota archaeon]MBT7366711.1 hypothetical protein [Candidatus Woesearchaeota archaeon]
MVFTDLLNQEYFRHLEYKKENCKIDLIRNPSSFFSDSEKVNLTNCLLAVARDGFGSLIPKSEVENNLFHADAVYLIEHQNEFKGFCSYKFLDFENQKLLFLKGVVIKQELQDLGLFYEINNRVLKQNELSDTEFDYLVMRTQSPVVYSASETIVKNLYPSKDILSNPTPVSIDKIMDHFVGLSGLTQKDSLIRGLYGRCLYAKTPKHKNANNLFNNILRVDYDAGDAVVLVGKL